MTEISEAYEMILEKSRSIPESVYVKGKEGRRGLSIPAKEHPQLIIVEFEDQVPADRASEIYSQYARIVEDIGWDIHDSGFSEGKDNKVTIEIFRDLPPEEAPLEEFETEEYL